MLEEGQKLGSGEPYFGWPQSPKRSEHRKSQQAGNEVKGAELPAWRRLQPDWRRLQPGWRRLQPDWRRLQPVKVTVLRVDKVLSADSHGGTLDPRGGTLEPRDRLSRSYKKAPGARNSTRTQAINL